MKELTRCLIKFCRIYNISPKVSEVGTIDIHDIFLEAEFKGYITEEQLCGLTKIFDKN